MNFHGKWTLDFFSAFEKKHWFYSIAKSIQRWQLERLKTCARIFDEFEIFLHVCASIYQHSCQSLSRCVFQWIFVHPNLMLIIIITGPPLRLWHTSMNSWWTTKKTHSRPRDNQNHIQTKYWHEARALNHSCIVINFFFFFILLETEIN